MPLTALTDKQDITQAMKRLKATVSRGAEKPYIVILTAGGGTWNEPVAVLWHRNLGFWAYLSEEAGGTQFWCCFGVSDPGQGHQRPIVQINPPHEGENLRCQGVFARDDAGDTYYLHTGRVTSWQREANRNPFVTSGLWQGKSETVIWPASGKSREMFVIGKVGDEQLASNLAGYVKAVASYRLRYGATDQNPHRIFFSHSNHELDRAWCEEFSQALIKEGAAIWYDQRSLSPGVLDDNIRAAIQDHPTFVVAMSPRSLTSEYVQQEIGYALELAEIDSHRVILPVMAERTMIPPELDGLVRVRGEDDSGLPPDQAAKQVIEMLRR